MPNILANALCDPACRIASRRESRGLTPFMMLGYY